MRAISLLTIVLLLPLLSAAPLELSGGFEDDNDGIHSQDENVTRAGKFFGHNQFDVGNLNISGSVAGDYVSIGHQVKIDHEAESVIECKEGLREMFKSIDSNKDGLMDAKELLRVCHQNNIQITESLAVRILTLPDKTVGFNMAKFCELLKDCPSNNSAGLIHFLLQLFDKASCSGTSSDWDCCSSTSPCQENEGDCDTDDDCVGSLVCGKDNCRSINPLAYQLADCCIQPVTIEEQREFSPPRPQLKAQAPCPDESMTAKTSSSDTWPAGFSFSAGSNVTLDFPLLLDTLSPRLASLHLVAGGHLVFSPHAALAKLTAGYVIVDTGASLSIGSERCPFEGKAEILLTGRKDSYQLDGDYRQNGEKFLSVMAGGKLEIHGRNKLSWTKLNKTVEANEGLITLYMEDDVSSWEPGDTIVLASTDFDMNQAEEVKVKVCRGRECVVEGGIKYHHYGLVDSGVDMRGEVGLITRNVLIHGEMEEECYGTQPCNIWGRDLFGGHVIATEGFDTFKVEHAEVTNMGQQGVMGRYPLHWHMAGDLVEGHSYVRSNSIHHNHQRCVTCHGSMGCVIEDNMAFESLGHCYFMEDGVEAATTMRGNLGINTRRGSMIPSDNDPSTFWITHPNSTITHNVAAGSRGKGFWFLQGANPTGASKKRQDEGVEHYFDKNELFHTALVDISHNVAHSSQFGIFFDKELGPDQGATGSGKFDPWKDPKNSKSERLDSHIQNLTCYKCFRTCVWIHLKRGQFSDIKTAESGEGMFTHDPTVISNSLFVGVSDGNMGVGRNWYRSLPSTKHQFGIKTYANPILLSNSEFRSFGSISLAKIKYTAIGVRRSGVNSLMTGAHNITWTNVSIQHRFREDRNKESRQLLYRDYSGSVSGHPNWTIVHTFRHLVSPLCVAVPEWGPVSVCPHRYIGLPPMVDKMTASLSQMVVTRDDIPDYSFSLPSGDHFFYLSTDHSHIISFVDIDLPASSKVFLRPRGLDNGMVVQLGVCVPLGATVEVHKNSPVSSMCALHEDNTGLVYFHDEVAGVVFVKMIGTYVREHLDVDPCGKDAEACPNFPQGKAKLIKIDGSGSASLKADCRNRQGVYPKYQILKSAPNPAPFDETRCMEEIAEYNAKSVTNPELHPITEEFPQIVVHGVHSMTLANLRYYFDKNAATNNGIPVINFNLSSSEPPVLRSTPDIPLRNNFTHPAMDALDMTLCHMTDNNWGTRNASPLERVIHAIHMLEVGLTNYAATYCIGMLLARRVHQKFNTHEGNKNIDGSHFCVEDVDDSPRAFRACLKVGLVRTSTGAKIFGAMKGALTSPTP